MNILVIAPHPDDEVIGCGGTLCKHTEKGDRVVVAFLTSGELGLKQFPRDKAWQTRETEARRAAKILGIEALHFLRGPDWTVNQAVAPLGKALRSILVRDRPGIIYLPHQKDAHPDHQAAVSVLRAALRGIRLGSVQCRAYEVWSALAEFDHVEDITSVMDRKKRALRAHRSQLNDFDYLAAVTGLNRFRGELAARSRYAEVFQTISIGR